MIKNVSLRLLSNIFRYFLGFVFIISGFVKAVDPMGTAYKITEYFNFMGMGHTETISVFLSIMLSSVEFITGLSLLLTMRIRTFSSIALIIMAIMTPLSLFLALFNPISDCGCFGDYIKLSNWETFFKNIILICMVLLVYFRRKTFIPKLDFMDQIILLIFCAVFILSISIYGYRNIPVLDFRPYSIGVNIKDQMKVNSSNTDLRTYFKYKNKETGQIKEFDETNYPSQDSLKWEFVDSYTKGEAELPEITSFYVFDVEQQDISSSILKSKGYLFLYIIRDVNKMSAKSLISLNNILRYSNENGIDFYIISSTPIEKIKNYIKLENESPIYGTMDDTQLKTIIRSNPGLLLLNNGTIIGKWGKRDIEEIMEAGDKDLMAYTISEINSNRNKYFLYFIIFVAISLFLYHRNRKFIRKYIKNN